MASSQVKKKIIAYERLDLTLRGMAFMVTGMRDCWCAYPYIGTTVSFA